MSGPLITTIRVITAVMRHLVFSRHFYISSKLTGSVFSLFCRGKRKRRAQRGFSSSQETKLPQEKALVLASTLRKVLA